MPISDNTWLPSWCLWNSDSATSDLDVEAAVFLFQATIHDDAAWHKGRSGPQPELLSNLGDACTLDTLLTQATRGGASAWNSTRSQERPFPSPPPRLPLESRNCPIGHTTSPPHPISRQGYSVLLVWSSPQLRPHSCLDAGDRNRRHNAASHVFWEAAQEAGLHPQKAKAGPSHSPPRPDSTTAPPTCGLLCSRLDPRSMGLRGHLLRPPTRWSQKQLFLNDMVISDFRHYR